MAVNRAGAPTCLLGLIGKGIQASKSPALHETEAAAQGFRCSYELFDLDYVGDGRNGDVLPGLLREAEDRGFAGLNITYPCKQAIIPLLHELSDEARIVGAVNTVRFRDGRRVGYNTDAWGFAESFRRGLSGASLRRVVQVGAGGAGAATAHALLELGARELYLIDTDVRRAESLATKLGAHFAGRQIKAVTELVQAVGKSDGVLNATPMGMSAHPGSAVPPDLLRNDLWVADIVYFPMETELLRAARAMGCRTLDGGGMVVFQAARAFEIFTGRKADGDRMRRHFETLA